MAQLLLDRLESTVARTRRVIDTPRHALLNPEMGPLARHWKPVTTWLGLLTTHQGARTAQRGLRTAQRGLRTAQRAPRTRQRDLLTAQRGVLTAQRLSVCASRTSRVPACPSPSLPQRSATACCSARQRHPRTTARCDRRHTPAVRVDIPCDARSPPELRGCGECGRLHRVTRSNAAAGRDMIEAMRCAEAGEGPSNCAERSSCAAQSSYSEERSACKEVRRFHLDVCSRVRAHCRWMSENRGAGRRVAR